LIIARAILASSLRKLIADEFLDNLSRLLARVELLLIEMGPTSNVA
jgi:hypothetical protein